MKRGFTLIELLTVIVIIGILASIVLVGVGPARTRGRDTKRKGDLKTLQNAMENYYYKNGQKYLSAQIVSFVNTGANAWSTILQPLVTANLIQKAPTDPINKKNATTNNLSGDVSGRVNYGYAYYSADGKGYTLGTVLETEVLMTNTGCGNYFIKGGEKQATDCGIAP